MSEPKRVPNTAAVAATAEGVHMRGWVLGGNPRAIEAQEAEGQRALVANDVLPSECSAEDVNALEEAGVEFGEKVGEDPLFRFARLPAGWQKVPTSHYMHSTLRDDKGRVRARIFYKAAFYDRRATMRAVTRFTIEDDVEGEMADLAFGDYSRKLVKDCGVTIYSTPIIHRERGGCADERAYHVTRQMAETWLAERFPNFEDRSAYWD